MTRRSPIPLLERGPLRVLFLETEMNVGGEEILLAEIIRRMDRERFAPELGCLKQLGSLGEQLADEVPTHHHLLAHKYDVRVVGRLARLIRDRGIDAMVTVGVGDKMFWGRLAAWRAGTPVILSAIHSMSNLYRLRRANRLLAPLTDAFIAVSPLQARDMAANQGCPAAKIRVVPNGVDVQRFQPRSINIALRRELGIPPDAPVAGLIAVLRPEKNHELFLRVAARVRETLPEAHFLIVGDGALEAQLKARADTLGLRDSAHFLGRRQDVPAVLAAMDLFLLTSDTEANPVSILEAMACGKAVVASDVGSVSDSVLDGQSGLLSAPGDLEQFVAHVTRLLSDPQQLAAMGQLGRQRVAERFSVETMVRGYEDLIEAVYRAKCGEDFPALALEQDAPLHDLAAR